MGYRYGRYSSLMKPLFGFIDLCLINASIFLFEINLINVYVFGTYASLMWIIISFITNFYEVQRHTRIIQVIPLLLRQTLFFSIVLYAFIGFFKQPNMSRLELGRYLLLVLLLVSIF